MSTRCNIVVTDGHDTFYIYHHCDGYPEGVGAFLHRKVNDNLKKGRFCFAEDVVNYLLKDKDDNSYEFTCCLHGDIEYLYEIDLTEQTLKCFKYDMFKDEKKEEINLDKVMSE